MSCPRCGDDCRCDASRSARPRFLPSSAVPTPSDERDRALLAESEAGDDSEQQFAASLEAPAGSPRFVPHPPAGSRARSAAPESDEGATACEPSAITEPTPSAECDEAEPAFSAELASSSHDLQADTGPAMGQLYGEAPGEALAESNMSSWDQSTAGEDGLADAPEWRQEVAARLHNYHSRRRKRPPRYPSLALKFDPPVYAATPRAAEPPRAAGYQPGNHSEAATAAVADPEPVEEACGAADATNIIEFPRPLVPPPPRPDELAEPVLDLPRILDAPEAVPKQVPLGGIILEPEEAAAASDLELPLRVAPLDRRLLAAAVDGVLVLGATLMFAFIANKVATLLPSLHVLLGLGVALPAILWAVFQYTFLVYTGTTPGMRLTGLRLSHFDGSVPDRGTRRWRALAMALSAVSLGLGFLWCLLDEDTLCWHDRITRTYLDAAGSSGNAARPGPMFPQRFLAGLRKAEAFLQRRERETSQDPGPWQS